MPRALGPAAVGNIVPIRGRNGTRDGLTPIHPRIHYPATPDTDDQEGHDELDRIDINNFLSTLAEVAISVARREQQRGNHEGGSLHTSQ